MFVFEILMDIEFNATKASVTNTYNTYTLNLGSVVNITSFEVKLIIKIDIIL